MVYICMDDMIMKKAKYEQLAINTKATTNAVLYGTAGVLIGTGIIGLPIVGNYIILIGINKVARIVIRKTKVVNKMRAYIKSKRVATSI